MKNILMLRGWKEEYMATWLRQQGFNVLTLDYPHIPMDVVDYPEYGRVFMLF